MIGSVTVQITNGELDRVRPASLKRYISREEWDDLADSIRRIMFKGVHHNDIMQGTRYICMALLLVSFASIFALGPVGMFLYMATFLLFFFTSIFCSCYRHCILANSVEDDLRTFLAEYSNENKAGVTFHLLEDGSGAVRVLEEGTKGMKTMVPLDYVLQVCVDQELGYHKMNDRSQNARTEDELDDVKIRLEKLERARHLLSEDEYNDRRQAILDSV